MSTTTTKTTTVTTNGVIEEWLDLQEPADREQLYASLVAALHSHHGEFPSLALLDLARKAVVVKDHRLMTVSTLTLLPWNRRLCDWFQDNLQPPLTPKKFDTFLVHLQQFVLDEKKRRRSLSSTLAEIRGHWVDACHC